jgi:hypothetical protein
MSDARVVRKLSRRLLAKSVGAGLLLSPFVNIDATPAPARRAKRLLLFCTMGTQPEVWAPKNVVSETSFTFSACTEPLAAIKEHVVLVDGLPSANPTDGHGSPDGLTGLGYRFLATPSLISLDQFVSDRLRAAGVNRPIPTLLLGSGTGASGGLTMFNRVDNLPTIASPMSAFATVFGRAAPDGVQAEVLLRRRRSMLDVVRQDVSELRGVVGSEERAKLDLHLDSLRQLENRLVQSSGTPAAARCVAPAVPDDARLTDLQRNLVHMDIIVGAFACDITRVAAIQFGSDQSLPVDMPDLGLQGDQHGQFIHGGAPDYKSMIGFESWLAQRFVDLVGKLKSIPEADGSGTLFDNTLVVWCRDMGDANLHNTKSMRFVLAGGAGGYLKTDPNGRYLYPRGDGASNRHERVLLAVGEAMGIGDFHGFGDPTLDPANKTPLPGLSST